MVKKSVKKTSEKSEAKKPESNSVVGFGSKLGELFFHPNKFLKSVEGEKRYLPLLRDYVLFYLFFTIISVIVAAFTTGVTFLGVLWIIVSSVIYSILIIFLASGVVHLGVLVFKGRQGFFNTYKPVVYALMIGVIYSILNLILLNIFPIDLVPLQALETAATETEVKAILTNYFFQTGVIVNTLLLIVGVIHSLIFAIKGISKFQKLSIGRSIGAVIIPWVIFLTLIILIILLYRGAMGS